MTDKLATNPYTAKCIPDFLRSNNVMSPSTFSLKKFHILIYMFICLVVYIFRSAKPLLSILKIMTADDIKENIFTVFNQFRDKNIQLVDLCFCLPWDLCF